MGFVVVGLDGSETSRSAFREAVREAQWREARLVAVHVVPYPIDLAAEFTGVISIDRIESEGEQLVTNELEALQAEYDTGFPVEIERRIVLGHSGVEIVRAAEGADGERAELVVLGSRGLGRIRGLLLGAVSTYVAHHLPCRLLIVPAEDE